MTRSLQIWLVLLHQIILTFLRRNGFLLKVQSLVTWNLAKSWVTCPNNSENIFQPTWSLVGEGITIYCCHYAAISIHDNSTQDLLYMATNCTEMSLGAWLAQESINELSATTCEYVTYARLQHLTMETHPMVIEWRTSEWAMAVARHEVSCWNEKQR